MDNLVGRRSRPFRRDGARGEGKSCTWRNAGVRQGARADHCVVAKTRAMDSAGLLSLLQSVGLASGHVSGSCMSESSTTLPEEVDDDEPSDDESASNSKLFGLFSPAVTNKKTPVAGSPKLNRPSCQAKPKAGTGAAAGRSTPSPASAEKAERTVRCRCLWCWRC